MSCYWCNHWIKPLKEEAEGDCIRYPLPTKTKEEFLCGEFRMKNSCDGESLIHSFFIQRNKWYQEYEKEKKERISLEKKLVALRRELRNYK